MAKEQQANEEEEEANHDDLCAICLERNDPHDALRMPGCGHRFHPSCMLTCAQYDARCPVCRAVGTGVQVREAAASQVVATPVGAHNFAFDLSELEDLHLQFEAAQREWRRYTARRRRLLRQRADLADAQRRLKDLRVLIDQESTLAQRAYDQQCREAWRSDPQVQHHRQAVTRLRRRELRLERQLDAAIEEVLGPEPE